jgi:hypothetical protein
MEDRYDNHIAPIAIEMETNEITGFQIVAVSATARRVHKQLTFLREEVQQPAIREKTLLNRSAVCVPESSRWMGVSISAFGGSEVNVIICMAVIVARL